KITMAGSPSVEGPEQFDAHRVRLADIDGTGTSDFVYLASKEVRLYVNQSGNSWSTPHVFTQLPAPDNLADVRVLDLLGTGTACIAWSSALPADVHARMSYVELMGGRKPHLLAAVRNNLGAETRVYYQASTRFYLQDYYAGLRWITPLPFPVHVVERV